MQIGEQFRIISADGAAYTARRLTLADTIALKEFSANLVGDTERWFRPHSYDEIGAELLDDGEGRSGDRDLDAEHAGGRGHGPDTAAGQGGLEIETGLAG